MSYKEIEKSFLSRKSRIRRKAVSKDSVGCLTESWTTVYNNIDCNIQEISSNETVQLNGREAKKTHIAYFASKFNSRQLIVQEEDELYDYSTNTKYTIIGVNRIFNGSGAVHHHRLYLEAIRQQITETQTVSIKAKGYISNG